MQKFISFCCRSKRSIMRFALYLVIAHGTLQAQGVTTSAMTGIVSTDKGEPLAGANIIAVHDPSGTRYGVSTRVNGQYNIPNMRIGGPYTVAV